MPSAAARRCRRAERGAPLKVKMFTPVILCGGSGTRLWPLSRELHPKQLLTLTGTHTMLQETLLRLEGLPASPPVVVCNDAHRFLVAEQLRQVKLIPSATILEPFGRNTAPPIAHGPPDGVPFRLLQYKEEHDQGRAREFGRRGDRCLTSAKCRVGARRCQDKLGQFAPDVQVVCMSAFRTARAEIGYTRIHDAVFE